MSQRESGGLILASHPRPRDSLGRRWAPISSSTAHEHLGIRSAPSLPQPSPEAAAGPPSWGGTRWRNHNQMEAGPLACSPPPPYRQGHLGRWWGRPGLSPSLVVPQGQRAGASLPTRPKGEPEQVRVHMCAPKAPCRPSSKAVWLLQREPAHPLLPRTS